MSNELLLTTEIQINKSLLGHFKAGYVLVVEDMPNMRRSLRNMLKHIGIKENHIIEAGDGDIALRIIQKEPDKSIFVLMLLDWNMPHVSGIEVLKKIKKDEKLKNMHVLMVTAECNEQQIALAVEQGAESYIIKPFIAKTLQEKMFNIINPPVYLKLIKQGEELIKQGKFDEALSILEDVLKTKPESASIRILMGKAFEGKKENEKAYQLYKEAVEKNPEYLRAHNTVADFLLKIGKKKEALDSLERAAKISPFNADRQITIGKLALENEKDPEKARRAFKTAMRENPQMAEDIAEAYLKNDKAEEAEMFFRTSLAQKENVHVYNRLGIALRRQKKWKKAIEEYMKALNVERKNETIFYNIGTAYLEGNKKKDAVEYFKKALAIDPNFEEAKKILQKIDA